MLFTNTEISGDKTNNPLDKQWLRNAWMQSQTSVFKCTDEVCKMAENFHHSMLEYIKSAEPEVQVIVDRENRDPTNMNSFLKVWFTGSE